MAEYVRIFAIPDVADTHRRFARIFLLAESLERVSPGLATATLTATRRAYAEFNRRLDLAAKQTAAFAQTEMRATLFATRVRQPTGNVPGLKTALTAKPLRVSSLATGSVGVADIAALSRVVNPRGPQYGPYWFAQEYGSRRMVNRAIYGAFFGPGGSGAPSAPSQSEFRKHPVFITAGQGGLAAKASGDTYLRGTVGKRNRMLIKRPIRARHFIALGADRAEKFWRSEIATIQNETYAALDSIAP